MGSDFARRLKATYAATRQAEMRKSIELRPGETVVLEADVVQVKSWLQRVAGILWLTNERFFLLEHYAFRSDSILEIPRAAILSVNHKSRSVWVEYADESATRRMELRTSFPALVSDGSNHLADALKAFQNGTLTS